MIKNKQSRNLINYLMVFFLLISGPVLAAAPAAGTVIKNQATATYKDSSGIEQTTTSNLVETLIQQVGAFALEQSQSRYGIADQVTSFPHILTNTGNGDDSFTLGASDNTGDTFDFDSINIYPDANQDGVADSNTPITTTGVLAAGESFYFVVSAKVPLTALDGNTGEFDVTGTSEFDPTLQTIINTDEVIVSDKAVITVTKSISANSGEAGTGPYTVTLTYGNQSTSDATDVTLIDELPVGMTYVDGSAEWSLTGSAVVLTDANPGDAQGVGTDTVVYCAYDTSCTNIEDQVTAVIAQVISGDSGTISFQVELDSDIDAQTLLNTGEFSYNNGSVVIADQETNTVPLEVISTPGVVANGSDTINTEGAEEPVNQATGTLGSTVAFDNIIWNRGNSTDTFDISVDEVASTFPAGTTFTLYQSDGFTPLLDTDNSSVADTGPLGAGEFYNVVLKAKLPMTGSSVGDNSGLGFDVTKTATSTTDPSITSSVTDHLVEITGSGVDITNVAAIGGAGVKGEGIGPETTAQTQLVFAPGESGVFQLYINNISDVADSFDLSYSKDDPFAKGSLPAGWGVSFHVDAGATDCSVLGPVVSNTSIIAPNTSKLICAQVSVAAGTAFDGNAVSIYFKAESPLTGVSDIKHDAVYLTADHRLILEPDHHAQVEPGGTQTYVHNLHNPGNTTFTDITLAATDTLSAEGWTTKLYEDTDGDGVLSSADQPVGTYTLAPGETQIIFAKVFAPSSAPLGATNLTGITASGSTDAGGSTPVVVTVSAQDMTYVAKSNMTIAKRQGPDANCDGAVDSGFSFSFDTFQAGPNTCVLYQLTATNQSAGLAVNVRIDDSIPEFTTHFTNGGTLPVITVGTITTQPPEGDTGMVAGNAGNVIAGDAVSLTFGVRVE
ncbi:hypothetical protein [Leucothrix arctica]|uniref:DUF11 domain-containing protein n=1 Tax=Leucothrix arctica TaxID=1481894 RepID=A0A317CJR3_9GAMM|nr:hypothetical protein [Leucothrix arctica]PWQ98798.1 hypothetical protein DKT75_03055 [Leucothrix arctica]